MTEREERQAYTQLTHDEHRMVMIIHNNRKKKKKKRGKNNAGKSTETLT